MADQGTEALKARTLRNCRAALDRCDEATLHRLDCMLGTLARGASLDRFFLSAPVAPELPVEVQRLLALFDPAQGEA